MIVIVGKTFDPSYPPRSSRSKKKFASIAKRTTTSVAWPTAFAVTTPFSVIMNDSNFIISFASSPKGFQLGIVLIPADHLVGGHGK
jgi:hypothetical protein